LTGPPPWHGQPPVGPPPAAEPYDPGAMGAAALAEMRAKAGDAHVPAFVPGRPLQFEPLPPAKIPPVDWRQGQP